MKTLWKEWHKAWLKKRIPPQQKQRLSHRNIFIMPSRAGLGFILLTVCLWLLGINYQNNLVLGVAYLLLALMLIAILHTYANLSGLNFQIIGAEPGFMGGQGRVKLLVSRHSKRTYESIFCYWDKGNDIAVSLVKQRQQEISIPVILNQRGLLHLPRLHVYTYFPLGILKAWSLLDMNIDVLSYPKPVDGKINLSSAAIENEDPSTHTALTSGVDEFSGLRDYHPGDSLKRVAWRSLARGQGLATKEYESYAQDSVWLDWLSLPGLAREERLSRLCGTVLQLEKSDAEYGLRLPGVEILPAQGVSHTKKVLMALALFDGEQGAHD